MAGLSVCVLANVNFICQIKAHISAKILIGIRTLSTDSAIFNWMFIHVFTIKIIQIVLLPQKRGYIECSTARSNV